MSTASAAATPNATGRPSAANTVSSTSTIGMRSTSRPMADRTKGLASTTRIPSDATGHGSRYARARRVQPHASTAVASTVSTPSASTGWAAPDTRVSSVSAPSSSTFSGEVAEFACMPGTSPHSPCTARFLA